MDMKITEKTEKPLLSRTEVSATVHFETATPSRAEIRKRLAEALKSSEELVVVRSIVAPFGERSASIQARVYKTKADLDQNESKVWLNKGIKHEKKAKEPVKKGGK